MLEWGPPFTQTNIRDAKQTARLEMAVGGGSARRTIGEREAERRPSSDDNTVVAMGRRDGDEDNSGNQ